MWCAQRALSLGLHSVHRQVASVQHQVADHQMLRIDDADRVAPVARDERRRRAFAGPAIVIGRSASPARLSKRQAIAVLARGKHQRIARHAASRRAAGSFPATPRGSLAPVRRRDGERQDQCQQHRATAAPYARPECWRSGRRRLASGVTERPSSMRGCRPRQSTTLTIDTISYDCGGGVYRRLSSQPQPSSEQR